MPELPSNQELPLAQFAHQLLIHGHAAIAPLDAILEVSAEDERHTVDVLRAAEKSLRAAAPAMPPQLNTQSALWALRVFGWAGYTVLDRNQQRTALPDCLSRSYPDDQRLENHWSVDIVFRFLPDLCLRARRIAPEDELHATLEDIARRWPISAVGMPLQWSPQQLENVMSDPSLRRTLVDRVTACSDRNFATLPSVQAVIRSDAGGFGESLKLDKLIQYNGSLC